MKNPHFIFISLSSNRTMKSRSESPLLSVFMFCFSCICFLLLVHRSEAQTDPLEVRALNSIFQHWGVSSANSPTPWNTTGDPCSGAAITTKSIDDDDFNPAVKCTCSSDNGTTCHIFGLKIYSMDIRGTIPPEISNLTKLFQLNLNQNLLTGPLPSFLGTLTEMQYLSLGINSLSGTIPKELGNLRKLVQLSFSSNNFSGPLPSELGNLSNLQQLNALFAISR